MNRLISVLNLPFVLVLMACFVIAVIALNPPRTIRDYCWRCENGGVRARLTLQHSVQIPDLNYTHVSIRKLI